MKIFIKSLMIASLLIPALAIAGSGKGIVPHWGASVTDGKPSWIYLSNITDDVINVEVSFYDKNGTKLAPSTFNNFITTDTQLAANSSGYVSIKSGGFNHGYAVIEWSDTSGNDNTVALVAHGYRVMADGTDIRGDFTIQINNGVPF